VSQLASNNSPPGGGGTVPPGMTGGPTPHGGLPFTGLDLPFVAAVAIVTIGAGFILRRRNPA
jgi:hypothetical protein